MQLIGFLSCALGVLVAYALGIANPYQLYRKYFFAGGITVWLAPGIAYLVASSLLRKGNSTGVITGLVAAGFQTICALATLVAQFILRPISVVPVLLSAIWLAAMCELLLDLRRCFVEMRFQSQERQRGFVPLPVKPPNDDNLQARDANEGSAQG